MMSLLQLSALLLLITNFSGQSELNTTLKTSSTSVKKIVVPRERKEDEQYIPWIENRRLSWNDFLCEPKRNTDAVASTSTALGIAYQIRDNRLTYQITCNFSKTRSWGLLKTPYILAHEQAHFDITEIFARKLNQVLQSYQLDRRTFKQDINDIYQNVVKEKEAFQHLYDGETDHSRNKIKQQQWLDKINAILEETQPFANYP